MSVTTIKSISDFPQTTDAARVLSEERPGAGPEYVSATSGQNGHREKRPDESIKQCVCHVWTVN